MGQRDHRQKQSIGFGTERIEAALKGRFDPADLEPGERVIYDDLLGEILAHPSEDHVRAAASRGSQPGAVGYNEHDQLVRVLPNGELEILEDTADPKKAK